MLREAEFVGVGLIIVILHVCFFLISVANDGMYQRCSPSSCGNIHNISYPFRLQGDPQSCGYPEYELICENNLPMINLQGGKYYVADINYDYYRICLMDPGLKKDNCLISSPLHSSGSYYTSYTPPFSLPHEWRASSYPLPQDPVYYTIVLMNCKQPVRQEYYIPIIPCNTSTILTAYSSSSPTYTYAVVGDYVSARDIPYSCTVGAYMAITPLKRLQDPINLSMSDLQDHLLLGLQLSFGDFFCTRQCKMEGEWCSSFYRNTFECYNSKQYSKTSAMSTLWKFIRLDLLLSFIRGSVSPFSFKFKDLQKELTNCSRVFCNTMVICGWIFRVIVLGRGLLGILCLFVYLLYKFHHRHLSLDDSIEDFLQGHKNLLLIKYSYSDIKKITHNFANKIGKGGFGSVYRGKLQSGCIVAVKMLTMSKANGQDFINEIATIGRIHHVNVVRLVGFCVQGSKWALIYDFMPNGSLDKFIFLKEENESLLNWEILYKIALGVGHGIEYLHRGCDMQILHFDIKPHNILLDEEDFTPKVSDFGLAKLYSTDKSMVSLTAARGTLGYIAPELFYKNIGGISYKADVYSFGMLLLEMVGRRKNVNANAEHSSQIYFPSWIYDKYERRENMDLGDITEDEKKFVRKMVIVSLWCIQMKPIDRPSMSKALEMLEGEVELLEMPPKPTLYSEEMSIEDHISNPIQAPIFSCNSMGTITLNGR